METSTVRNWLWGVLYELRLKVIKLLVGDLSVIVNAKVYGPILASSFGLVYNAAFQSADLLTTNQYCAHVAAPLGAQVVVNRCVFDASDRKKG